MKYEIKQKEITIFCGDDEFDIEKTLTCGQIFSFKKDAENYFVFSCDKVAKVKKTAFGYSVETENPEYFENFFDLKTDYNALNLSLLKLEPKFENIINFGKGIRILKQDKLETIISFAISANNNIERIKKTLFYIRENAGERIENFYAFPTLEKLKALDESFFIKAGCGYRSRQLVSLVSQLSQKFLTEDTSETEILRKKLMSFMGIGGKVADCIMLFAYSKKDVFPVDTWIEKVYKQYFDAKENNREKMRNKLVEIFGEHSGYAQQLFFFFKRSLKWF